MVIALLAGLLALLGSLQWRWLGQISDDERERKMATLGSQVREFTQDFDRELTRAYFWLQMDRSGPPGVAPAASTAHFQRWFTSAPEARIVSDIYTVTLPTQADGGVILSRYDQVTDALVRVDDVPARLLPVIERLRALPPPAAPSASEAAAKEQGTAPLHAAVPALVIPRPPVPVTVSAQGSIVFSQSERPWDFTVAVLDTGYMRETFLRTLVEREFGPLADLPYRVAVTDLQSGTMVFCSVPGAPADGCAIADADVSREFFELRLREFSRFIVSDDRRGPPRGGRSGQEGSPRGNTIVTVMRPGDGEKGDDAHGGAADGARRAERGPLWRVDVTHRAGSLEAVVSATRNRNLFVSSSILLLLGVSVALIVVSSGRARRLASQQMEFVAGVSHELRTPLAVIRSAAENLADGVVAEPGQVQQYGALIAGEGRRLTEMVEQVMEFAGFDAGRTLELRPVAVHDVVETAVASSHPLLTEQGATLDVHVDEDLPSVLGNHAALARVLLNLVSNAVKYGGEDRWVGLSAARAGRDQVVFRVSDHGDGIPDEDLPHIFEPFFRGRPGVDGHIHGSGLGLSLVARIVAQHKGKVQVDTHKGRGTTFAVTLPAARGVPARAEAAAPDTGLPMGGPAWKRGATT